MDRRRRGMTFWTDNRIAYLRDQAPHRSASQIAADIGCTRNAVIGKAHRLSIALGKPAMEAPPPVVAPPPPPTPKSVAAAEIQRGKYKQTQPGTFQARCAACGVHSPETDWGSRGPKRAAVILRRLGWRLRGMGATTAWTCAACEGVVAPTPVARPIIVRPPVIVCEPANPKRDLGAWRA